MADPTVFISSTSEDLKEYRAAVRDAAMAEKFHVEMQEYFPICDVRPLAKCMESVDAADLVVVIVAERYGWVPADQAGESKSITWLECLRAAEAAPRKEVLAFLVAKDANWPVERKDSYRASVAMEKGESDEVLAEIRRDVNGLKEFRSG